jgi:hypothetical protein
MNTPIYSAKTIEAAKKAAEKAVKTAETTSSLAMTSDEAK